VGLIGRIRLVALGAALAYFFDPASGRRRRKAAVKRLAGLADRLGEKVSRVKPEDELLAYKVKAELFGDVEPAGGRIDVNAASGKIVLSGEADSPQMIDDLVARAREVEGVSQVESRLLAPGEPAPASE